MEHLFYRLRVESERFCEGAIPRRGGLCVQPVMLHLQRTEKR
jgi:hypothetical protein